MKIKLSWMMTGILVFALAAIPMLAQDRPQDEKPATQGRSNSAQAVPDSSKPASIPGDLYPSVINSTETQNLYNDTQLSEMWKSAPAAQNTPQQMLQRVASQTSPDRGSPASGGSMIWMWVILAACLLAWLFVELRPAPREVYPVYERRDLRRVA